MNLFSDFIRQLGTWVLRLVALLAAMVFAISLVLAALLLVAGVSVWSLLTGRKPAPWVLYQQLRERGRAFQPPFGRAGVWPSGSPSPSQSQTAGQTATAGAPPFSRSFPGSFGRFTGSRARMQRVTDVVDVQATEVPDTPRAEAATGSGPATAVPDPGSAAR